MLVLQVMKGGQIQASGLDHPVGWPRIHTAVATNGCVPVVCESEAQRLAPIMTLQINNTACGELASLDVRYRLPFALARPKLNVTC